ncbi:hypothetical protein LUZ60_017201 [Juncus effusus]|nr:hypothetical protein LUZ60_017201 [Juncus effusus]
MATLLSTPAPLWLQPSSKSNRKLKFRFLPPLRSSSFLLESSTFTIEQPLTNTGQTQTLDFPTGLLDLLFSDRISPSFEDRKQSQSSIERMREEYERLKRRQVRAETEAWDKALEEYKELERKMLEKKLAPNLPYVKSLCLSWFEQLTDAIERETEEQKKAQWKHGYAEYIGLLPADKMAVIVMSKVMEVIMPLRPEGSIPIIQVAIRIGEAIEQEYKILVCLEKMKNSEKRKDGVVKGEEQEDELARNENLLREMRIANIKKPRKKILDIKRLIKKKKIELKPWPKEAQVQLACRLIQLLIESAYVQVPQKESNEGSFEMRPAFRHNLQPAKTEDGKLKFSHGVLVCDPLVYKGLDSSSARHMMVPYLPMLVPPKSWKGYNDGAYFCLPSYIMRTHGSKHQQNAMKYSPTNQLDKVYEALDALGSTKWRINTQVLDVVESLWSRGGGIAGLVDRNDIPMGEKPETEDQEEIKKWKWIRRKARKANSEMHALRCDTELVLSVARRMRSEAGFHYPHNMDFRGRAYPMHPHLSHLSSDLCRGLLQFSQGKPLGKSGLKWLKIHIANLFGNGIEKLSYDLRLDFVEKHLGEICNSAENPFKGQKWWLEAEDPFQCLAACFELNGALKYWDPRAFVSHIHVHQDGSCNGLQHYAALGRFAPEAASVNLVAGDIPADVYSGVAARVLDIIQQDSKKDPKTFPSASLAKLLVNQVDRKLVKQTVMTSVYGVTYIGAREQIKRRLQEKGFIHDENTLFKASCYASKVTLSALGEMFQSARGIMGWLSDCAKVITSENEPVRWTTPLGLPVVQPYRVSKRVQVRTSLQMLCIRKDGDKVSKRQQRTAFPPNFVHSLDSSHMMMTAIACHRHGLTFAGVHDSYWTHACDVDKMNRILREKFVELYSIPILENLLESFETSFPELEFPPLPETGDFDLRHVLDSPYFFN